MEGFRAISVLFFHSWNVSFQGNLINPFVAEVSENGPAVRRRWSSGCCWQTHKQCQQGSAALPVWAQLSLLVCLGQDGNVPTGRMCPALQNQLWLLHWIEMDGFRDYFRGLPFEKHCIHLFKLSQQCGIAQDEMYAACHQDKTADLCLCGIQLFRVWQKMCGIRISCQASCWFKCTTDRVGACDCLVHSPLIFQISLCFLPWGLAGHQQKGRAIHCSFSDNKQRVTAARNLVAVL